MIHEDGNMVALMDIFAHTSDKNGFRQAKQASGNLTPRDSGSVTRGMGMAEHPPLCSLRPRNLALPSYRPLPKSG
jgi:hypothetical protein